MIATNQRGWVIGRSRYTLCRSILECIVMETVIALWLLGVTLVAVGIAGVILPALPGPVLIFAGFLVMACGNGWVDC